MKSVPHKPMASLDPAKQSNVELLQEVTRVRDACAKLNGKMAALDPIKQANVELQLEMARLRAHLIRLKPVRDTKHYYQKTYPTLQEYAASISHSIDDEGGSSATAKFELTLSDLTDLYDSSVEDSKVSDADKIARMKQCVENKTPHPMIQTLLAKLSELHGVERTRIRIKDIYVRNLDVVYTVNNLTANDIKQASAVHDATMKKLFSSYQSFQVSCERIECRPPTNIALANHQIVGRARDTAILGDWLRPDNETDGDVVIIYGRPKIGLTTVALQAARVFTRPRDQATFMGGVFRINLANCDDPKELYSYVAQAMNMKDRVFGSYSYFDDKMKRFQVYDDATQKELYAALSGDTIADPIETFGGEDDESNAVHPEHYIILNQHKNHEELLQYKLPDRIFQEFERHKLMLPAEFYIDPKDDDKVCVRRVKFTQPDEEAILMDIQRYGVDQLRNDTFESQKLFIIDHINFAKPQLKQFLQKIKRLVETVKCKLLLACHDRVESMIQTIDQKHVAQCRVKHMFWRIKPITKLSATKLLLETARQLYAFDFQSLQTPSTAEETSQFPLFEWLSKSPALIQQCSTVLDRKVPFCVIINMMEQSTGMWHGALNEWTTPLKLQEDEVKDALNALTALLTEINAVRSIWSDIAFDDHGHWTLV